MPTSSRLKVAVLYPDHLNIYADRGNLAFLQRRCEWRGIGFESVAVGFGESIPVNDANLIYIGGGQDRDQALCAGDLVGVKAAALKDWFANGQPLLAVCGGFQLLGLSYSGRNETIPGIAAADLETAAGSSRLIGPIAIRTDLGGPTDGVLAGFENHAGRTHLGPKATPLGRVIKGHGNDGESGFEGVRNGSSIGTYLHGPLLPKNWWLADWLIARSLGIEVEKLGDLDDDFERKAHLSAARAAGLNE